MLVIITYMFIKGLDLVEVEKGILVAGKVSDILGLSHALGDLLGSLDLTELNQRISRSLEGLQKNNIQEKLS